MTFASNLSKSTSIETMDTVLIEKVRWSIRQRLRKQMSQLVADFFDEVDDYLFASGQQGQFSDNSTYLKAMRELRAKQSLFEENFINTVIEVIKTATRMGAISAEDAISNRLNKSDVIYEKVEIDLAIQAMNRKAIKHYLPLAKQIESINQQFIKSANRDLFAGDILIKSTIIGFAEAQSAFSLVLDVRLVFIKLFEQNFLLKMEKLYLDIISILNKVNDKKFIEKLYSSSSECQKRQLQRNPVEDCLQDHHQEKSNLVSKKSDMVESAVKEMIASVYEQKHLPIFAEKMIRTKWRAVMFVIGLNRGTSSLTWHEAKHTASLLATALSERIPVDDVEWLSMTNQLQQGFGLIQMDRAEQDQFMADLENYLVAENLTDYVAVNNDNTGKDELSATDSEVSISPLGEDILDRNDLDEIAMLISGDKGESANKETETTVADYFQEIDRLEDGAAIEYLNNGNYEIVAIHKSFSNPDLFEISCNNLKIAITRSRLGLAISLQAGELRLVNQGPNETSLQKTILESPTPETLQ